MDNKVLKDIIMDQRQFISKVLEDDRIIDREVHDKWRALVEADQIKVALGARRAGKTVFSILLLRDLDFGYVNFDDERLAHLEVEDLNSVLEVLYEVHGDLRYVVLDEVQNIQGWELFVNRLHRTGIRTVVTGSNANLLSQELATHLTGRHFQMEIFPFSFREFLKYRGSGMTALTTKDRGDMKRALEEYIRTGGFPEVVRDPSIIGEYLSTLYSSIITKDIIARHKIRYVKTFREMAISLISSFSTTITFNRLKKVHGLKSVHTVKNYVDHLCESYLLVLLEKYSHKPNEIKNSAKKVYVIDPGMIGVLGMRSSENIGRMMENLVMIDLLRKRSIDPMLEFYYWKDDRNREVDFVIKRGTEIKELIQVTFSSGSTEVHERELTSLLKASADLGCSSLKVITWDQEANTVMDGKRIEFAPLWRWLTEDRSA
ncbi:MAG: ATP-binding protein [Candidatus Thermoplasmatota archaeon]|nr:ATP-binding protein [Candidatus Thermoplasmatota archaeon]